MAIKTAKLMGDFETTTKLDDCRVWASCLVDIETGDTVQLGTDIESMFEYLENKNTVVYFHNLKFDGEFILSYLLANGYKYSDKKKDKTFDALITDGGLFYSITVIFKKHKKKYQKVVFYDSLKKLPFKAEVIAKAFELPDSKLKIDYQADRERGHQLTKEEVDYITADCRIVAGALKIQMEKGLTRMTNASDALHNYKDTLGRNFERWFPVLPVELDADIRRAYKGGFTYLNPKDKGKHVRGGLTFDVNSLYPWVMYTCLLPYGYPMYFEGKPEPDAHYPLFIVHMRCTFKLKDGHIPCLQLKNNRRYVETEYLTTSEDAMGIDEPVELHLTSVDYQLLLDHYDIDDVEYINGWKFKGATGMFKDYIDHWMHIKETTTGALRQLAKLMLNSLYGRFALNPRAFKRACYMDEDGVVKYEVIDTKEKAERYGIDPPELRDPVYTAMGCFITAYARNKTIRSAQAVYDRFIYADTDSLHLEGTQMPEGMEIHPTHLGAWKFEGEFVDSKFIRQKTYMETMKTVKKDSLRVYCTLLNTQWDIYREADGIHCTVTHVTCAGMPDNVKAKVTYDNFNEGSTFDGKLMPKRVKGGVVLVETTFTIK